MLAQVSLIVLIVMVYIYTLSQLHQLTSLSQEILTIDAASIEEGKRLLRIILAQMRSAEKFVLLQDKVFYAQFLEGNEPFEGSMGKITALATSPRERDLLGKIRDLHEQYAVGIVPVALRKPTTSGDRAELSDGMIASVHALIQLRAEAIAQKRLAARD